MSNLNLFSWTLEFLGSGRDAEQRTRYNSKRPLPVISILSDNETCFLQMARMPYAKMHNCAGLGYPNTFIMRENEAWSLLNNKLAFGDHPERHSRAVSGLAHVAVHLNRRA